MSDPEIITLKVGDMRIEAVLEPPTCFICDLPFKEFTPIAFKLHTGAPICSNCVNTYRYDLQTAEGSQSS